MKKADFSFRSGLAIGAIVGVIVAGVGLAHSGVGKKAWNGNGWWFQAGYLNGFLDAVQISKSVEPQGHLNETYLVPKDAKFTAWQKQIDKFYEDPAYAEWDVPHLMVKVGPILEKEYGPDPARDEEAGLNRLKEYFDARKQRLAERTKTAEGDSADSKARSRTRQEKYDKAATIYKCKNRCRAGCRADCKADCRAQYKAESEKTASEGGDEKAGGD